MESIHSATESDEFVTVSYVAVKPRKRDFFRVLFGTYVPKVKRVEAITAKGLARELKAVWTTEKIEAMWLADSPLNLLDAD